MIKRETDREREIDTHTHRKTEREKEIKYKSICVSTVATAQYTTRYIPYVYLYSVHT